MRLTLPRHAAIMEVDGALEGAVDISSGLRPVDPADEDAHEAMHWLAEALEATKKEVYIHPGTALVINNRRVVHARGPVESVTDDPRQRRWLQRVYGFDLDRMLKK